MHVQRTQCVRLCQADNVPLSLEKFSTAGTNDQDPSPLQSHSGSIAAAKQASLITRGPMTVLLGQPTAVGRKVGKNIVSMQNALPQPRAVMSGGCQPPTSPPPASFGCASAPVAAMSHVAGGPPPLMTQTAASPGQPSAPPQSHWWAPQCHPCPPPPLRPRSPHLNPARQRRCWGHVTR